MKKDGAILACYS